MMRQVPDNPEDNGFTQTHRGRIDFLKIMYSTFFSEDEIRAKIEEIEEEKARKEWQDQGGF
jgi:hypothetical protein